MNIFLSHAAADVELAKYLDASLRDHVPNAAVFRTTRVGQIPSGLAWFNHIATNLQQADVFIILLTPSSHARPWVNFECGAAFFSKKPLIPVLGGGLAAHQLVEPLKRLQALSLEDAEQAKEIFSRAGGQLDKPEGFVRGAINFGEVSKRNASASKGWKQFTFNGQRYAWDGPLASLLEGSPVPMPPDFRIQMSANGLEDRTGVYGDLMNEISQGYQQIWLIDEFDQRRPVLGEYNQVFLVRPRPSKN